MGEETSLRPVDGGFRALVLAGDRGVDDPLLLATGGCCKAMTPVAGRPSLERVLEALGDSGEIEGGVEVNGPEAARLADQAGFEALLDRYGAHWVAPGASPASSTAASLERMPTGRPVLVTTGDHALLNPAVLRHFFSEARKSGHDLVVGLIPYPLVETAFPGVRRTVLRFRGGGYCGGNLFAFLTDRSRSMAHTWIQVEAQRKRPARVLGLLGWGTVLRYLLGRLTVEQALARLSRRTGLSLGAVILPFPEAAVDVDSPSDLQLAEQWLRRGSVA